MKEQGYFKILYMTKEKLLKAEEIDKYTITPPAKEFLSQKEVSDFDVLAVKIYVGSPVKVENVCLISDSEKLNEFAKLVELQK